MDLRPIRIVHYGLGTIGRSIARLISQRSGMQLVGAIEVDPAMVGQDLGAVLGLERQLDAPVSNDPVELLRRTHPDLVIHATSSLLHDVKPQLTACLQARTNVISTCEELVYPYAQHHHVATQLDALARRSGVALLGSGANPGFIMDLLPLLLTAPCSQVSSIYVTRVVDAAQRRPSLQQRIGAGLLPHQFRDHAARGLVRHIGLKESLRLISDTIGWQIERMDEHMEPVIAEEWVRTSSFTVAPGQVAGIHQVLSAQTVGHQTITLDWQTFVGAPRTCDMITIQGVPSIKLEIDGGLHGDLAAAAIVLHAIPHVLHAAPGLHTVADLPVGHYVSPVHYSNLRAGG
jgi:4-hydroxy-tetrahydrodipicolinate reductase